MSKDTIFMFVAAMIYLSILVLLVRPNSKGPTVVLHVLDALSDLVRGSIGYTYDAKSQTWSAP